MTKNKDQGTPVKQWGNEENISANNENYSKGEHPNSKANLKPFPKGVSGNPLGRPHKFVKLAEALDKWANKIFHYDFWDSPPKEVVTMKEQVLWRIWDKARHGDNKCIELLARLGCLEEKG